MIKAIYKKPPPYFPSAEELKGHMDSLLMHANIEGKEVEGFTMDPYDFQTLNRSNLLTHDGAFMAYRGVKIWT